MKSESEHYWNTKDKRKFVEKKMNLRYDEWQWDYITTEGNTAARVGRQSGKSEGEAARLGIFSLDYKPPKPGLHLLITGGVERQAYELYQKVRRFLEAVAPSAIRGKVQEKKITLKSGLIIRCLPAGRDGSGLRNYAAAKIAVDEAHYVEDAVFVAIEPMLLTTGGTMDLMSTTRGNKGYFREAFFDNSGFTTFHFKTRDVIQNRKVCDSWTKEQRAFALEFLDKKEKQMTKNQFKQEFEAEFLDSLQQFFPQDLIDECILEENPFSNSREIIFGADFGGCGADPSGYINLTVSRNSCYVSRVEEEHENNKAWEIIKHMDKLLLEFNYLNQGMGIDSGGIGSPILDYCLRHDRLKLKIVPLNSATKPLNRDGTKSKTILKNDMYYNLKLMMERGIIKFPSNSELIQSLTSIQQEVNEETLKETFHGRYDHLTDALIRAAWIFKSKGLSIFARNF